MPIFHNQQSTILMKSWQDTNLTSLKLLEQTSNQPNIQKENWGIKPQKQQECIANFNCIVIPSWCKISCYTNSQSITYFMGLQLTYLLKKKKKKLVNVRVHNIFRFDGLSPGTILG